MTTWRNWILTCYDGSGRQSFHHVVPLPHDVLVVAAYPDDAFEYPAHDASVQPGLEAPQQGADNMGLRISEQFLSNFIKAEILTPKGMDLIIKDADLDKVGNDVKVILSFKDSELLLPLNKTNAEAIKEMYGDDTDGWKGQPINIFRDLTMFKGKRTACVRVRAVAEPEGSE